MATFTWHFAGKLNAGTGLGPAYRLDQDYSFGRVWAHCPRTRGGNVQYDIKADGVSILSQYAVLTDGGLEEEANVGHSGQPLDEGAILTFDCISAGARDDATFQLDLEEA